MNSPPSHHKNIFTSGIGLTQTYEPAKLKELVPPLTFYACGDKNTIRAYVNTPATAKLAIVERNKYVQVVGFSFLAQKTP